MGKGYEWKGLDPSAGYHRSYKLIEIEEKLAGSEYENIFMMRDLTGDFINGAEVFYMKESIGRI